MASKKTLGRRAQENAGKRQREANQQKAAADNAPVPRREMRQLDAKFDGLYLKIRNLESSITALTLLLIDRGLVTEGMIEQQLRKMTVSEIENQLIDMRESGVKRDKLVQFCLQRKIDPKRFEKIIGPAEVNPIDELNKRNLDAMNKMIEEKRSGGLRGQNVIGGAIDEATIFSEKIEENS